MLLIILPIITAPYVARVLGPEQSGIYDYTNSIQTYFAMFAALGTASYGAREIARVRNDAVQRSILFWEIELMTVMTSAACIAVWFVFIAFTSQYKVIYLVLTMGLFSTMFDISWFFAGMEQFKYTVTKNAACKLIGVALMFMFVKNRMTCFYTSLSSQLPPCSETFPCGSMCRALSRRSILRRFALRSISMRR